MTVIHLAREVLRVRECQRQYFRLRSAEALAESKAAEKRLDRLVREVLNPPPAAQTPDLFDEGNS